jgi:hypothetical protein
MTLYVANGVFTTFESGTGADQLVVANGSFALFLSGTGGNIIYSGSVGRFSVSGNLKQPSAYLIPVIVVSAGRFSCSSAMKISRAFVFQKKHWSVESSSGDSVINLLSQGLGYYQVIKSLLQVGPFVYSNTMIANALTHGDSVQVAQMLMTAFPDGFVKNIKTLNGLTGALKKLQKHQIVLSADEVVMVQNLIQSLAAADDVRTTRKLMLSVSNPESRFESVPSGIYIDGRII